MARKANARLVWDLSISPDVVSQKLVVKVGDVDLVNTVLDAVTKEFPLQLDENTQISVDLAAFDGTYFSKSATLVASVGDLTEPLSPTNLGLVIDEIVDV